MDSCQMQEENQPLSQYSSCDTLPRHSPECSTLPLDTVTKSGGKPVFATLGSVNARTPSDPLQNSAVAWLLSLTNQLPVLNGLLSVSFQALSLPCYASVARPPSGSLPAPWKDQGAGRRRPCLSSWRQSRPSRSNPLEEISFS